MAAGHGGALPGGSRGGEPVRRKIPAPSRRRPEQRRGGSRPLHWRRSRASPWLPATEEHCQGISRQRRAWAGGNSCSVVAVGQSSRRSTRKSRDPEEMNQREADGVRWEIMRNRERRYWRLERSHVSGHKKAHAWGAWIDAALTICKAPSNM
jgi:hypothetical protein